MPTPQDPHRQAAETAAPEIHPSPPLANSLSEGVQHAGQELAALEEHLTAKPNDSSQQGVELLFDEADALFSKRTDVHDSQGRYANQDNGPKTAEPVINHGVPLHHSPPK
jgi:hypothetical protein